ncbi:unnamed protein product [Ambrosiozyma monospora]|uniref:Unnamed protein product n=1 Tax=Ambrosiozyma monospora TaxID=43982 RepID=A0ACB5T766_AMBMO|nr:unnamed protein product [Ambrosiozyma monospora]
MQFTLHLTILAFICSFVTANFIEDIVSDGKNNKAQYQSYIDSNSLNIEYLYSFYNMAFTATDDSYTTAVDSTLSSQLSSFVTGLPWYSSRILNKEVSTAGSNSTSNKSSNSSKSSSDVGNLVSVDGLCLFAAFSVGAMALL